MKSRALLAVLLLSLHSGCEKKKADPVPLTTARLYAASFQGSSSKDAISDLTLHIGKSAKARRCLGDDRIFTWSFDDGSSLLAYCRPAPGYKNGLVLYRVEITP
jgi:hypothetical protein